MSFAPYRNPESPYTDEKLTKKEPKQANSQFFENQIPPEVEEALVMTPLGINALRHYKDVIENMTKDYRGLGFFLTSGQITDGKKLLTDSGFTTREDAINIVVYLTNYWQKNDPNNGRFYGWSEQELYNVVITHESRHITYQQIKGKLQPAIDECEGWYSTCHEELVAHEFKSRIQYSLIHQNEIKEMIKNKESASKASWLKNYIFYFEAVSRWNDEKYLNSGTSPSDILLGQIKESKHYLNQKNRAKLEDTDEFKKYLETLSMETGIRTSGFDFLKVEQTAPSGYARAVELYQLAIENIRDQSLSFERNTSFDASIYERTLELELDLGSQEKPIYRDRTFSEIP